MITLRYFLYNNMSIITIEKWNMATIVELITTLLTGAKYINHDTVSLFVCPQTRVQDIWEYTWTFSDM